MAVLWVYMAIIYKPPQYQSSQREKKWPHHLIKEMFALHTE